MSLLDKIPESHRSLLDDGTKAFAWVAAVMPNGGPQLTAVWFNTDGENILFGTSTGAAKYRYFKANDRVAISIPDPDNPYKYIQLRGRVQLTEEGAVEHTHALSRKYTGKDFDIAPGSVRVMYKVKPQRILVWPPVS